MIFLFTIFFAHTYINDKFSFILNHKRKLTLRKVEDNGTNTKQNLITLKTQPGWYYVHFLIKDLSKIQKYIEFKSENILMQDTYLLFLNKHQIDVISNVSLIKRIEPNEKYIEDAGSIETTDLLVITTTNNYELPINSNDYNVEQRLSDSSFVLKINNKTYKEKIGIIKFLSDIPEVQAISTYKYPKLSNSLMTAYSQYNSNYFVQLRDNTRYWYMNRYFNSRGITGENEVITIVDTSIDFHHAMFRDDDVQIEFNKYIPKHRKIVYYSYNGSMETWEKEINEYEHGTHVACTASGKSICSNDNILKNSIFNGNAPDAKIAYGGSNNYIDFIKINDIINVTNSKISSNSWGNDFYSNIMNFQFSAMALINSNVTFISAAGNDYEYLGNFSIRDPQGSKNVLTVGALKAFNIDKEKFVVTSIQNPELSFDAYDVNFKDIWINASIGNQPGKTDILAIDNKNHNCKNLLSNNKFLIYGGGDISWIFDCDYDEKNYPNFLVTYDSTTITQILNSKSDVSITKNFKLNKTIPLLRTNYSSTGPGPNGVLKPDLMAPGDKIISAKSRHNSKNPHGCGESKDAEFILMNGTSMAAPNIAGAAALIRHYFNSDRWIDKVILDGETTRALLINSCEHPLNSKIPDIMYGHGVVDLSTGLPVDDSFGVQITPQRTGEVDDNSKILSENSYQKPFVLQNGHVTAKLDVNTKIKNKKLQITLSYLDTLINMDTPIPIIRDLDLIVTSPSKKIYYGDHLANNDTQHTSTNEKVIINENEIENGTYTIHVYGGNFVDSIIPDEIPEQEFSVVASGPILNGYLLFSNSTECPCDRCDKIKPGYCLCNNDEIGQACQIKIDTINGNKGSFTLQPLEFKRVMFNANKNIKKIYSKSSNPGHDSTIWASKDCHLSFNEYEVNGYSAKTSDSDDDGTDVDFKSKKICVAIFNNNDKEATYNIEVSDITPTPKPDPTREPTETEEPKPSKIKCDDKSSSSGKDCSDGESAMILGDFNIRTVYLGASTIVKFNPANSIMREVRKIFGQILPPPNFIHSAIWVTPSDKDIDDDTLGAIFVYGRYHSTNHHSTYLFEDGARSYAMSLGEFKKRFNSFEIKKLTPQRSMNLFDFIKEVKSSGRWKYSDYNWPTNNCQHFTSSCLNILKAIRCSSNTNDWIDLPDPILKTLQKNENEITNN